MHYLSVDNISKSFGIRALFSNLSFNINEGDKIALIAKNGSGKSTLINILCGKDNVDNGKLWIHKEVSVALFEQDPKFEDNLTIAQNVFHSNHPIVKVIQEYEIACENAIENPELMTAAIEKMESLQAWDFDAKVKQILGKLQIFNINQKVANLSGGQKKRIALAQTLIDISFASNHVLLIMDEPTNHLDVEMIEWLEQYLSQEKCTILLVSHDRYFLDNVCNQIWEIDNNTLYFYKGDYESYLEQKAARVESEVATISKAKNTYRTELEWMRKQPRARGTKSKSRQDNFYEIEAVAKKKIEENQLSLNIKMNRLGGKIAELKKVYLSFGEKTILKGFDYTFSKGERLGIIGKNGTGKSSFIKVLQQIITPDSGKINIGETIVFGNFSQQGLNIKEDMRVIEFVKKIAENFPLAKGGSISAAQFLELFLFTPEQQYTYISKLSGGEKKRLQLLSVLFSNPNFLILDEPTNDLDLPTLSVLERFLSEYAGCLIVISHDRYFMDRLVDHLFVFEGNGVIKDFPGNYSDYRIQQAMSVKQTDKSQPNKTEKTSDETLIIPPQKANKKLSFKEQKELQKIEEELHNLEIEKLEIVEKLTSNLEFNELQILSNRMTEITNLLEEKELRWLSLNE